MQRLFDDVVEYVNLIGSGWRRRRNRYPDHCCPDLTVSNGFVECIPSSYALLVRCLHHRQIRRMVSSSRQYYRHQKKQHRAASYQSRQIDYNMFPTDTIFSVALGSTYHHYYHHRRIFHQRQHRYVEWSRQCSHLDGAEVRYYWSR